MNFRIFCVQIFSAETRLSFLQPNFNQTVPVPRRPVTLGNGANRMRSAFFFSPEYVQNTAQRMPLSLRRKFMVLADFLNYTP
jgi:hypothetical protein